MEIYESASITSSLRWLEGFMGLEDYPKYRQDGAEKPEVPFLPLFVLFTLSMYGLETYLDIRQHRCLRAKSPPSTLLEVLRIVDSENKGLNAVSKVEDKFGASQRYGVDKSSFHFVDSAFDLIFTMASNLLGWMPWLWDFSAALAVKLGLGENAGDISVSLIFVALGMVFQAIIETPFSIYSTFVVEQRHGFNKQTLGLFFTDKLKNLALMLVISAPALACILKIIELGGRYFYVYLWVFMFAFSVLMLTVAPVLIMPLFNKYTPLEDGELKSEIEALAARVKFPLGKLFVVDGSKRSGHSNAYFYGFFKNKRIVLYDTLINQADTTEIVSILGHELGHWKMSHTIQGFVITQAYMLVAFTAFALATELGESLRQSFGYSTNATIIPLYLFFAVMWAPVDHLLQFLLHMLSRKNEFEADAHAVHLGYAKGLQSGLVKLQLENLGNMNPDPWYSTYHYSHPPLVERLQAIESSGSLKKGS